MDASDAAEYVQELAGDQANIIFGAMYDDSRADEATITVIATGLHNVGGSASKLKSRLENQRPGTVTADTGYERTAVKQPAQVPKLDLGMAPSKAGVQSAAVPRRTVGGTAPSLEVPKTPTSRVKEQSIKIPDFFRK